MRIIPKYEGGDKIITDQKTGYIINMETGEVTNPKTGEIVSVEDWTKIGGKLGGYKAYLNAPITEDSHGKSDVEKPVKPTKPTVTLNLKEIKPMSIIPPREELKVKIDDEELKRKINNVVSKITTKPIPAPNNSTKFSWLNKLNSAKKYLPEILDVIRFKGDMNAIDDIYEAQKKGVRPNLQQPYLTHRQVVGDEATKQAYYRRAVQGETKAAQPFTSDADRQMAYQYEAKRIGDELRAQGDLADNQEIRRTSDESNQHQWANIQRLTDTANYNSLERNKVTAALAQLEAQRISGKQTNLDNWIYGKEARLRQEDLNKKKINAMLANNNMQLELFDSIEIAKAREELDKAIDKSKQDGIYQSYKSDPKVKEAQRKLYRIQMEEQQRLLEKYGESIYSAKKGSKLSYTQKDDLLYKVTKDVVKHFREMSKMADDSRIKTTSKKLKLIPHPKKMQQGGVAPFPIYRPVVLGGETTISSQATSSEKSSADKYDPTKEKLDFVKKLFQEINGKGLTIDVNQIYKNITDLFDRASLFGDTLSSDDIAGLYLSSMNQLSQVQNSKAIFDKSKELIISKDAYNEFAVTSSGQFYAQKDGKVIQASLKEITDKGYNPLTNGQLLFLRENTPNMSFGKGDFMVEQAANSAISLPKITEYIQKLVGTLGSTSEKIEGLSQVESDKVKKGLQYISQLESPDGWYKITREGKNNQGQILAALQFIQNSLPSNYKAILDLHLIQDGIEDRSKYILSLLGTRAINETTQNITPLTGKASDKEKSGKGSENGDMLPAVAFFQGLGEKNTFVIQDKTNTGLRIDTVSAPITLKGANVGTTTLEGLSRSDFGGQLNISQASMGGSLIAQQGRTNILINDRIYQTELPIDEQAAANGIIKPDLLFLKRVEEADKKLREMGIDKHAPENADKVNQVYKSCNLPIVYQKDGDGKPVLTSKYARFAMVDATATEDAFEDKATFNDGAIEVESDKERTQFEQTMQAVSGNNKYKLDNGYGIFGGGTKLYKGIIYIPMVTNTISALGGTGYKGSPEEYNRIEALQQQADYARLAGFDSRGGWSE